MLRRDDTTRQYGRTVHEIRSDHVKRYCYAASHIPKGSRVLDLACGCGYGSWIMHRMGLQVTGVDISSEAISYAEEHYKGPKYLCQSAEETKGDWDVIVSFETLEHLVNPVVVLGLDTKVIVASVPNENKIKFVKEHFASDKYPHQRHYTPRQFSRLFAKAGYKVVERRCQVGKEGRIVRGTNGMFLIYTAMR